MMRRALVLRPEPGNGRTAARLAAVGVPAERLPLFAIEPRAWTPPDANAFDALLLTSANAVRHAGAGLAALAALPVVAVGEATAAAARGAGLTVATVGTGDALAAARAADASRLLHLAGADRVAVPGAVAVTVYASVPVPVAPDMLDQALDAVVLCHSARAAARFAALFAGRPRDRVRIAALSAQVAAAAGEGWARVAIATRPDDPALVACAATLAIDR